MTTLQIRDERARLLAQQLASRRKITMTEAVIQALEGELTRDKESLADRLRRIAIVLASKSGGRGRIMTKDEVDAMWGP